MGLGGEQLKLKFHVTAQVGQRAASVVTGVAPQGHLEQDVFSQLTNCEGKAGGVAGKTRCLKLSGKNTFPSPPCF